MKSSSILIVASGFAPSFRERANRRGYSTATNTSTTPIDGASTMARWRNYLSEVAFPRSEFSNPEPYVRPQQEKARAMGFGGTRRDRSAASCQERPTIDRMVVAHGRNTQRRYVLHTRHCDPYEQPGVRFAFEDDAGFVRSIETPADTSGPSEKRPRPQPFTDPGHDSPPQQSLERIP